MRILIDGDACPVMNLAIEIAKCNQVEVVIFCDTAHYIERSDVKVVIVSKGSDAVDFRLINELQAGDILITQDYGLAAMGLAKKACPIHQNGFRYTDKNMDQLLFTRHLGKEVRRQGGRTKGPSKRGKEEDEAFCKGLVQLIHELNGRG